MLRSLFRRLLHWLRRYGQARKPSPPPPRRDRPSPLRLESLEERRMMSANTTIPTPEGISLFVALGDVMMTAQREVGANIVYLGDSITWGYKYGMGAAVWSAFMAGAGAADYGVIGQTTQSLLYQLSLDQLAGQYPSVIVLTIGTNNLLQGDTPQATAAGILADVAALHQYEPQTQILVLGVPPGMADPHNPYRTAVAETNALVVQQLAGDPRAAFFDIAPAFEQPDGSISHWVLLDFIHPTALGYAYMTATLLPPIQHAYLDSLPFRSVL